MAVRIRLRRIGKKKQPQYRLVVADSAAPRDGRFLETIGQYNPRVEPALITVSEERALWWLRQGARPSDTALSLLKKSGVWEKFSGEPVTAPGLPAVGEEAVGVPEEAVGVPMAEARSEADEEALLAEAGDEGDEAPEPEQTPE